MASTTSRMDHVAGSVHTAPAVWTSAAWRVHVSARTVSAFRATWTYVLSTFLGHLFLEFLVEARWFASRWKLPRSSARPRSAKGAIVFTDSGRLCGPFNRQYAKPRG